MIKIGVIGCGKISQVRHFPEYAAHPGAELAGYYDLNYERASRMAEQYGGTAYGTLEELLEDPQIDAVSVCTANNTCRRDHPRPGGGKARALREAHGGYHRRVRADGGGGQEK